MFTVETDLGAITISKSIIGRIVTEAIDQFDGRVMVSTHKGKVAVKGNELNSMEITYGERGLDVRVFVVLRFGTSITMVTNQLVDEIHENIKVMTGSEPNSVAVVVAGMISKNIARRYIEVTR